MFRQCHGYPFDFAHAPVFLAGIPTGNGVLVINAELSEVSDLRNQEAYQNQGSSEPLFAGICQGLLGTPE